MRLLRTFITLATIAVLTACGHDTNGVISDAASREGGLQGFSLRAASSVSYSAVPLPSGFVPWAIMPGGQIPGRIAHHAAIYANGRLTILPDYAGCGNTIHATGANDRGEVVGFCNVIRNGTNFGIPLYYNNGTVKRLSITSNNNYAIDVKINDSGVIVGNFDPYGLETSGLYRLYSDGDHPKVLGDAGGFWPISLNNSGEMAVTQFYPGLCCQAAIANLAGSGQNITGPCSQSNWISKDGTVVGYAGCNRFVGFEYKNGNLTYMPGPIVQPMGINASDTIVGSGHSGIILFVDFDETNITGDISPPGSYKIRTYGLSDDGAFVAVSSGKYYEVAPTSNRYFIRK